VVKHLAVVLDGSRPPGMYRWRSTAHRASVCRGLAPAGVWCHFLDGGRVTDAAGLFAACAIALRFPDRFSGDWEGMADCLGDLSWLPGRVHVLVWEHYGTLARNDPPAWETAREVFSVQATASGKDGPPLYVLLRGTGPVDELPVL
jgi:hypothetical protein